MELERMFDAVASLFHTPDKQITSLAITNPLASHVVSSAIPFSPPQFRQEETKPPKQNTTTPQLSSPPREELLPSLMLEVFVDPLASIYI